MNKKKHRIKVIALYAATRRSKLLRVLFSSTLYFLIAYLAFKKCSNVTNKN